MKKQFLSKAVPRGTRTIWRYLSALFILFTFAIGNVWAELTAHTPGVYEKTTDKGGYGCTLTTVASGANAGTFEVYYFSANSKYGNTTNVYGGGNKQQYRLMCADDDSEYQLINTSSTSAFTNSCDWIEMAYATTGFSKSDYTYSSAFNEFFAIAPNGGNTSNTKTCCIKPKNGDILTLKVSGYVEFAILGNDNGSSKYMTITVDGGTPTSWKSNTLSRRAVSLTTGEHTIVVACVGNSANAFYGFSLKLPSCDDANASIIANTSIYVNDALDLEFSSDNTNSVVYDIKKGGSATSDASVTAGVFKATVAGTYVVTATQAKDASDHCAVEESVTITVNSKTPVSSVSISGDATAYIGIAKTLTATADQAVSEYKWEVDGVDQGVNAASFNFSAAAAGTYSVVCKARNSFNDPGEYIASSAHSITVTKLCGELIRATRNGKNIDPVTGVVGGTATKNTQDNGKLGSSGHYWKLVLASGNFMIGDVVTVNVSTAAGQGTLAITTDQAGANVVATAGGVGVVGDNELTITETVGNTIWLSRDGTNNTWNGVVDAIYVTRSCAISDDCSIKSLTINGETITPSAKVYSYEVAAASTLTEVEVAYTIHPLATGTPASGFNVTVPSAGDPANTQTITVVAEDGTHSDTYTVSISKATAASDVVTLDALAVTGYTLAPTFDAATLAYNITKAYGTADPTADKVTYTKSEEAQSVDVVYDGTNHKFVVTVTAEDNTHTQDYEITINEAEAPKSLNRVLFSNGFDAFIDNTNHTVKAYYLAGTSAPTATTITAGAGTAGELAEGKITVTGADDSYVDYIVTLAEVTPNTATVAEADPAGEFAGDEAWVKNGLLIYGNAAGYDGGDGKKWYVNRRLTKGSDPEDDQRVIAGWVRSYFFVGNASKFIMTVGNNKNLDYAIDGGTPVENVNVETLEIALTKGNHMIEIVSHQSNGDCRLSAPKLVELPASHTVTYMPGEGTGAYIVDDEAIEVADCPGTFTAPTDQVFNGWKDGDNNDVEVGAAVTTDMVLTAQWINHYAVTFNLQGHGDAIDPQDIKHGEKATKPVDPVVMGFDFGGWFTDAACTAGNEFDFETPITAATPLFAKWTEFEGCVLLYPALSGDALHVGDNVAVQTGSKGGSIAVVGMKEDGSISYNANGLFLSSGGADVISVTLNNDIAVGTKIFVTLMAANTGSRGLNLLNATGGKVKGGTKLGWDDATLGEVGTFSYTVEASDGLEGTNIFRLQRNNSVYLQCVKVESCGAAIVYHNMNSAVDPTGKGTVTLGASSVREGYTTTATYSEIDPLYEFVSWSVSGAGASIADASANPATITMGTEDAVVTLNLQLIPVKFTVNYYDGETPMGTEEVAVNENPTASEIDTDKRHYTFQGWAETDGGDVVALNTITRTEAGTVKLYAKYEAVACPTEGTVFSMEFDPEKAPTSTVKVAKNGGTLDLADYATLVGGNAVINNTETSDKDAISTDGKFKLTATKEVMKIELECAIATGDVIRIPDNNQKYILSTKADKAGTYQSQTSSQHEFEATAAWNGVDDLYILYDGSSLNFTKVYVLRPYTVSFDLQGHGDAIDAQKLVEGKKVEEPTAPTADGWDFGGWYKEAACTNAWDFDNDVVDGTMSLFAKWTEHVTNDATLKSLKYGTTDITLLDGIYSYDVELAAAVASVPALSAETNAALATKVITNAEAFEAGQATSTVLVTAEDGATQLLYTVNFTKEAALPQVNVTEATVWNFATAVAGSTSMENLTDVVLANVPGITNDATFNSQALKGTFNKMPGNYFQGSKLSFTTEVPGKLTITFRGTNGNTRHLQACVGDGETVVADWVYNSSSTSQTKTIFVPAGKVTLKAFEDETPNNARIYNMIFNATPDYEREVSNNIGTLCVEKNVPAGQYFGATFYQIASRNELYNDKIDFEEVLPNEELKAGEPYIFQSTTGKIELFYGETVAAAPVEVRGMIGNFAEGHLDITEENKLDILYIAKNKLWNCEDLVESGLKLNDHRAYIKMSKVPTYEDYEASKNQQNAAPRRRVTIGGDAPAVTTGIENGGLINGENGVQKVLINGQIFILRGEKMYDATGRLVK